MTKHLTVPRPIEDFVPQAPDWSVDWGGLRAAYPWIERLHGTPHDQRHHYEGDVGIHVRMVCEEMALMPEFQALSEEDRRIAFASALVHDIAKPDTTRLEDDGSITSKGHSRRGSIDARILLWRAGWSFEDREQVARLTLYHQWPFRVLEKAVPEYTVIKLSQEVRVDLLAILAEADSRGRLTARLAPGGSLPNGPFEEAPHERQRSIDNVLLFRELAAELGCLDRPYPFPDNHTRWTYLQEGGQRSPDYPVFDDRRSRVVVMSGLPGTGKSTWLQKNEPDLPVVGFDEVRAQLGVDPEDNQGAVVQAVLEAAREHLRAGRDFAWNATNVSVQLREKALGLLADYSARIEIVYLEEPEEVLRSRNRARKGNTRVPDSAIDRMLLKWEPPLQSEGHQVRYISSGQEVKFECQNEKPTFRLA